MRIGTGRLSAACGGFLALGGCAAVGVEPRIGRLAELEAKTVQLEQEVASLNARLGSEAIAPSVAPGDAAYSALYQPAPDLAGGASLFLAAELGRYPDRAAAEDQWRSLAGYSHFKDLEVRYRTDAQGETALLLGPFTDRATVEAVCAQSMLPFKACRVTRFTSSPVSPATLLPPAGAAIGGGE